MNATEEVTSFKDLQSGHVVPAPTFEFWDNPEDPLTEEARMNAYLAVGLVLMPMFTLLGVPGNIISAVVFYRQGLRDRINLCLFSLAIVDLVVVLDLFITYFESQLRDLFLPHAWFFATKAPGLIGFVWASQFLSAVIASERCFCVVSPFHAKRLLKTSTMSVIIVVCCGILIGGMAAIAGPKHTVIAVFDTVTNTSREIFSVTRYYLDNKNILDPIDIFVYATVLPAIFFLVIVFTTSITIIKLKSAASQRKNMTGATEKSRSLNSNVATISNKEMAVTRMLIGTSILFLICLTPNLVGQITTFILPELSFSGKYYNMNLVMWLLISLLRVVNCSVNVCVYYALGSKFRQTVHGVFGCHGSSSREVQNSCSEGQTDLPTV